MCDILHAIPICRPRVLFVISFCYACACVCFFRLWLLLKIKLSENKCMKNYVVRFIWAAGVRLIDYFFFLSASKSKNLITQVLSNRAHHWFQFGKYCGSSHRIECAVRTNRWYWEWVRFHFDIEPNKNRILWLNSDHRNFALCIELKLYINLIDTHPKAVAPHTLHIKGIKRCVRQPRRQRRQQSTQIWI